MDKLLLIMAGAWTIALPSRDNGIDDLPEQIIYAETGPHGVGSTYWHLWANGQGRYSRVGAAEDTRTEALLAVGPDGFRRIMAALKPLEGRRALNCREETSDQANGRLTWARGIQHIAVHFDHGCIPAPGEDAFDRLRQVNDVVRGWAAFAEPARTLP